MAHFDANALRPGKNFSDGTGKFSFTAVFPIKAEPGYWHVRRNIINLGTKTIPFKMIKMREEDILALIEEQIANRSLEKMKTEGRKTGKQPTRHHNWPQTKRYMLPRRRIAQHL
ncbi:MAG: hypothetical protein V4524_04160 [Patescibacteria group bacterium]